MVTAKERRARADSDARREKHKDIIKGLLVAIRVLVNADHNGHRANYLTVLLNDKGDPTFKQTHQNLLTKVESFQGFVDQSK